MKKDPIAALEIGTSNVVVAVAEPLPDNRIRITAHKSIPSMGVRKSRIVDMKQATYSINATLKQLLDDGVYDVARAYLAVTGPHVDMNTYATTREIKGGVVNDEDLADVYNRSFDVGAEGDDRILLDTAELGYALDDVENVEHPKGMAGRVLKLRTLAVRGSAARVQDAKTAAAEAKLEIDDVAFAGTCAANAVLTPEMKRAGALVIDLGGGSTTCCAYVDSHLVWTYVLGVGGDHVTNDVRHAFSLVHGQAEEIKKKYASCLPYFDAAGENARIEAPSTNPGFPATSIARSSLDVVVNARMGEIFSIVLENLDAAHLLHRLGAGVVLTGGGACLKGVAELAASTFGLPCRVGALVPEIEGLESESEPVRFATVAGLLLTAAANANDGKPSMAESVAAFMKGIFRK